MLDLLGAGEGTEAVKEAIWEMNGHRDSSSATAMAVVAASVGGEKVIHQAKIKVCLTFDGTNYATIHIFWEDYGYKDYNMMGLYGTVNTRYNIVKKTVARTLSIYDPKYEVEITY